MIKPSDILVGDRVPVECRRCLCRRRNCESRRHDCVEGCDEWWSPASTGHASMFIRSSTYIHLFINLPINSPRKKTIQYIYVYGRKLTTQA